MMNDLPDLDFEREHAALFQKLAKERAPVGETENQWLSQWVSAALREDVVKMKIAQSALKKLQTARRSGKGQ